MNFHDAFAMHNARAIAHLTNVMHRSPAEANRNGELSEMRGADGSYLTDEQADIVADEQRDREIEEQL